MAGSTGYICSLQTADFSGESLLPAEILRDSWQTHDNTNQQD
jgi:hypothetical protein